MHVSDYNFYNLYNMEIQYIVLLKITGIKKDWRCISSPFLCAISLKINVDIYIKHMV